MKRPLAYITAAWSGDEWGDLEQAAQYSRATYEARNIIKQDNILRMLGGL